jgi:hypothetical protein
LFSLQYFEVLTFSAFITLNFSIPLHGKMVHGLGLLLLAGLASAQSLPPGTCAPGSGKNFFRCASNGFNGCCTVDACSLPVGKWCPDYEPWTYTPKPGPVPDPPGNPQYGTCPSGTGSFYKCASNGFAACCTVDACSLPAGQVNWCPDYEPWTYTPKKKPNSPIPVTDCVAGSGKSFYKCASTGFNGCCSVDACQTPGTWCPDYDPWTYTPIKTSSPPYGQPPVTCPAGSYPICGNTILPPGTCAPGSGQNFYRCEANKFTGCCSKDACDMKTGPWYVIQEQL